MEKVKVPKTIRRQIAQKYCGGSNKIGIILTDRILALICSEIEKMENPYPKYLTKNLIDIRWQISQDFRQKILALLKED